MTRTAKKVLLGVLISLFVIAVAFVITVLVMASVHDVSFVEEIKSWFDVAESVSTVEESVKTVANVINIK